MPTDTWQQWAQDRREGLQKRLEAIEEPRWVDITSYGLRRSTRPLDASLFEKVTNAGLPKGELKLHPEQELWATQGKANATKVDSIPLNVPGKPIVLLRFKTRLWVVDGHHRVARARKEGVELPAVVYDADLQVAKHLEGEHDQQDHDPTKVARDKGGRPFIMKDESRYGQREVAAYSGSVLLGQLSWNKSTGEITHVSVLDTAKRRGIASQLLDYARELDPNVKHSRTLTSEGKAWSNVTKAIPEPDPEMEEHVRGHMNRAFGGDLGDRTTQQVRVNADNLTERDGIYHRTGGRWKKQTKLSKLLGNVKKHLQGQHDQGDHGRRSKPQSQLTKFDPPAFVDDAVGRWFAEKGGDRPSMDWANVRQDHQKQMRIADAYDDMPAWDKNAESNFRAMADETKEQFDFLTNTIGVKFEVTDEDPYRNVRELVQDVSNNRRLRVLSTRATGGHPYFSDEENDRFRFVHDFFGHVATGRDFDRHGEEAAYLHHAAMYSEAARPAMTSETRGQNASLIKNREFPEQKVALMPEEFSKHLVGMHNQKTHGRRHHDMMRFTRDVLGGEVKWTAKTWLNPSGNTMMDRLGNPSPDNFRYKTSAKHPGLALLWNDDDKSKAVLLSRDKSGRSKMREISGAERFLRRGQLVYGNYRAARETGERIKSDLDRILPPDFKQRIMHTAGEKTAPFVARHARRAESNVNKSIKELLAKHADHNQQDHDPTKGQSDFERQQYQQATGAYGTNDIGSLFGAGPIAPTPWPRAGRRKGQKPYSFEIVRNRLLLPPRLEEVDPRWLRAFQPTITKPGVNYYLADEWEQTGETYGDKGNEGNRYPFIYDREDGQSIILAGHHRAAAALLRGRKLLALRVKGPWGD